MGGIYGSSGAAVGDTNATREKRLLPGVQRWLSPTPGNPDLMYSNSTVTYAEFKKLSSVILANKKFFI